MIKFKPFKITISGNNRDDLIFDLFQLERNVKRIADEKFGTAATKYESSYPFPTRPSIDQLNKIERQESVGPKSKAYEEHVEKALNEIVKRKTGRCILEETNALPEDLFILPVGSRDRVMLEGSDFDTCDANLDHISATAQEAVPPVKYSPWDAKTCKPTQLFDPETGIIHELAHGVRPNKDFLLKIKTGDAWTNLEEFFAVLAENIYRSERNPDGLLRGGHDDSVLDQKLRTSQGFLNDKTLRKRTETVYKHEKLAQKLGKLASISFNPFALVAGVK